MQPIIRKAELSDRESIHAAHMRSIREVCVKDHGAEEIKGWGYRELGERWIEGINQGLVWVVEYRGAIYGLAAISIFEAKRAGHIQGMYLTPEVIGLGSGRTLMTLMLDQAKEKGIESVSLDSTITAHEFYKKLGFSDCGPAEKTPIGGSLVTSYPMKFNLADDPCPNSSYSGEP